MTLSQWQSLYHQTVFNPGATPYVLLYEWPNQLPSGAISELFNLSDYYVEPNAGGHESYNRVWLRKIMKKRRIPCESCDGSGKCQSCGGDGLMHPYGDEMAIDDPCDMCESGECADCEGTGFEPIEWGLMNWNCTNESKRTS